MSNINFDATRQVPLAATHPLVPEIPASKEMSFAAKVIAGLALLFFAAFAYVLTTRRSMPPTDSEKKGEPEGRRPTTTLPLPAASGLVASRSTEQQIANDIASLRTAMQLFQAENGVDTGRMFSLMDSSVPINASTRETLIEFVAHLRDTYPRITVSGEARRLTNPKVSEIQAIARSKGEAALREASEADRAKRALAERERQMKVVLEPLKDELRDAIRTLDERTGKLEPAAVCYARYTLTKGKPEEIETFQERFKVTDAVIEVLREEAPTDQFVDRVQGFKADFPEDTFIEQQADLQRAYESYKASIENLNRHMQWKQVLMDAGRL